MDSIVPYHFFPLILGQMTTCGECGDNITCPACNGTTEIIRGMSQTYAASSGRLLEETVIKEDCRVCDNGVVRSHRCRTVTIITVNNRW